MFAYLRERNEIRREELKLEKHRADQMADMMKLLADTLLKK
jgi:hypothetical protein